MAAKKIPTKQNKKTKPDSVYFKDFDSNWGKLNKIGVSNAVPLRLAQLHESGDLRQGKVIHQAIVPDAYGLESALHKKFKHKQFIPPKKFDGCTELFKDLTPSDSRAIIQAIQANSEPLNYNGNHGTMAPQYNEDYEPADPFKFFLFFAMPFVIFFLTLYFKK